MTKEDFTLQMIAVIGMAAALVITIFSYKSNERPRIEEPSEIAIIEEVKPRKKIEPATEETTEVINLGEFRVTAYCSCPKCCGEWADGITATGTVATEVRTIAVDPDIIPLGSVVEIDGSEYVAEDIGGSIKGNRVDIYFSDHNDALAWGVQDHDIFLIEFTQFR